MPGLSLDEEGLNPLMVTYHVSMPYPLKQEPQLYGKIPPSEAPLVTAGLF